MGALRGGDAVEDRLDLVGRLVLVAADLELDERGVLPFLAMAGSGEWTFCTTATFETRADDVVDRRA